MAASKEVKLLLAHKQALFNLSKERSKFMVNTCSKYLKLKEKIDSPYETVVIKSTENKQKRI